MKKLFSVIIILAITINMLLCVVSANGNKLTYSQAEKLLIASFQRAATLHSDAFFHHGEVPLSDWWVEGKDDCFSVHPLAINEFFPQEIVKVIYKTTEGKEYNIRYRYFLDKTFHEYDIFTDCPLYGTLIFKSLKEIKAYANEVLTPELAEKCCTRYLSPDFEYPIYIEDAEGTLVTSLGIAQGPRRDLYKVKSFSSTENSAVMVVYVGDLWAKEDEFAFSEETVEFTNTDDGWRSSGGSLYDLLTGRKEAVYVEIPENFIPVTGDESAYKIPALTVAALISVALPVSLLKKRRASA